MERASEILRDLGVEEECNPAVYVRSGIKPDYEALRKIPECEKDLADQALKDAEAAEFRESMEVYVFKHWTETDGPIDVIIDGSGEGIAGPGIYMEHMWEQFLRRFIKQHVLIDAETRRPVAVCITMERPGDSAVFPSLVKAAAEAGVKIRTVYADGAYDTAANWKLADMLGIGFEPNLKGTFGPRRDLPERNRKLAAEKEMGKTRYHIASGYNTRWHIEVFFAVFKKMFGERIKNRKFPRMVLAMRIRYGVMDLHKTLYSKAMVGAMV